MRAHHVHYKPPVPPDPLPLFETFSILGDSGASGGSVSTPPSVAVDTSREAASRVSGHTARIRMAILLWLKTQGSYGATAGEITAALGLNPSTVRPRLRELQGEASWAPGLPKLIQRLATRRKGMRVYEAL